jgi:hypothetical protein
MLEETPRHARVRWEIPLCNCLNEIPMFKRKSLVIALDADGLDGASLAWSR